jgi:hypothetical protein
VALGWVALGRHALALEPFGAAQPALGHPAPSRLARRIARELGHLLAIGGVPQEFFGWIHRSFPPDVSITLLGIHTARASSGGFEPCLFVSLFMAKPLGVVGEPQPAQGELTPRRSIVEAWGCFREFQAFAGTPVVRIHGGHRFSALTSAVDLKFLSVLRRVSSEELQIQNRTRILRFASGPWIPKLVSERAAGAYELRDLDH